MKAVIRTFLYHGRLQDDRNYYVRRDSGFTAGRQEIDMLEYTRGSGYTS